MSKKFSRFQRDLIKQLVAEAMIQRFTGQETLDFVKGRLQEDVSIDYLHQIKRDLRERTKSRLNHLRKHRTDFIDELFFKRRDELDKYIKELWKLYHSSNDNKQLQKDLIHEMRDTTIILRDMYDMLPTITGLSFITDGGNYHGEKTISEALGSSESEQQEIKPVV